MSLSRTEKRFLVAGNAIAINEAVGNKVAARIARAEWQQCYDMLGAERARELLELKNQAKGG